MLLLLHLPSSPSSATQMARYIPRAALMSNSSAPHLIIPPGTHSFEASKSPVFGLRFHAMCGEKLRGAAGARPLLRGRAFAAQKDLRKARRRAPKSKEKELELSVSVSMEEALPENPEISTIAELIRVDAPAAMKLAFDGLKDSVYKTRDNAVSNVGGYESTELSLMLGDIVISVETAARQAEQRGHTLLDEMRILMVHGLLHLLGFDHELSEDAEVEMEKEEDLLLKSLGWKGKGLIQSVYDAETHTQGDTLDDSKREGSLQYNKPKFRYVFCDMDGTLLNSKSQLSSTNVKALKEASSRGVKVVIATGKARPAVMRIFKEVDLAGEDGIVSEFSPGVFLQGLLVYGRQGREIFRRNLDANVCREACLYSLGTEVPLIAFTEDRCLTLFDHPLVDSMHTVYQEQKAEIMPSVEHLVAAAGIQKLVFMDTPEGVTTALRPYWSEATGDCARVVQTVPDMLEIVPPGTSKGSGVNMLLGHLGITPKEIMAIGDGENDIEMLELASLGIALSNGAEKTKAVANVVGLSNDEDGVADAIYRYAL
ncbi:unnamed protein product [Prunus armeniaca]|uniref:Uncharacterized protein n=1 Tax=Prunus armeniaca TaxID=36596 RepID=A0A6J5W6A5_PRUAR|nr:unnamed protein product [Prunus armeniaca]